MTKTERAHYWQQQIEDWKRSGLSGAAFCKASVLSYHQFVYWRSKLRAIEEPVTSRPDSGFVRVSPVLDISVRDELTLTLPSGLKITGLNAGNVELLGAVLRQL